MPEIEIVEEAAPKETGGRPPKSWCGAKVILAKLPALKSGQWLKITPPPGVPRSRIRWGVYRTAKNRGLRVQVRLGIDGAIYVRRA